MNMLKLINSKKEQDRFRQAGRRIHFARSDDTQGPPQSKLCGVKKNLGFSHRYQHGENGLVSIVIVSTIIIILALTVLGFSRIMDRELRQALDRELSSQAQYAAESGLNAARAYVLSLGPDFVLDGTECLDTSALPFVRSISGNYNGSASDNLVKYTCVLINNQPKDVIHEIQAGQSKLFKMVLPPGESLSRLVFSWENSDYCNKDGSDCDRLPLGAPYQLPQESPPALANNQTGLLRTTIYPIPSGPVDNGILASVTRHYFLYPNAHGIRGVLGSSGYGSNGVFINGNCNPDNLSGTDYLPFEQGTPRYCNSQVSGGFPNYRVYYVRLTAVYQKLSVSVQAESNTGQPIAIRGAQAVIDITGEGNDVLRRVQARVSYIDGFKLPDYALQSIEELCKRFRLPKTGPGANDYSASEPDSSVSGDPSCLPQN